MQMRAIALGCVLLMAAPAWADVCFGPGQSDRLLEEVEECRQELPVLRDLAAKDQELVDLQAGRISDLERDQAELLRMQEAAIKQMELARKAGEGSWWDRLLAAGKWIGLGILAGFAAGASK